MDITTTDGTRLHATDWGGTGRAVVLVHAWGLDAHMWNAQLPALLESGHRVGTFDRRGHGRSDLATRGYDLDTLAGDVGRVLDALDLHDVVLVGHSMGGTECARLVGGLGTDRVGGLVLSAPITPCLTAGPDNPVGAPAELFAAGRALMTADMAGWIVANTEGYWGVGDDARAIETDWTQRTLYATPVPVLVETNRTITGADLRADLAAIACPTLVIQGDADRSAPLMLTGRPTAALLPNGRLHVIEGAGHGLYTSYAAAYNEVLVSFVTAGALGLPLESR